MVIVPLVYAGYLSLYRKRLIGGTSFAGAENYIRALTDPLFLSGVGRMAIFLVLQVPFMIAFALFFALALDSGMMRLARFSRLAIFVPYAVPGVVATLMWGYLYGPDFGPFAQISNALGLGAPPFLTQTGMLFSIMNIVNWSFIGYNMIIIYAALRSLPSELYEAARVDGASEPRIAWSIKIPAVRPALLLTVIFGHRHIPAVHRTETDVHVGTERDRHCVVAQPVCLQRRVRQSGRQLRGRIGVLARDRDHDRLLHRPAVYPTEGARLMTTASSRVTATAIQADLDEPAAVGRNPARRRTSWLLTVFVLICVGYFLLPLFWLVVASTKSNADLFSTFGLWFANFNLFENIKAVLTFQDGVFIYWAINSAIYAVVSAVGASFLSTAAGYGFAKYDFPGKVALFAITLGAIMIPIAALTVPTYLLFARAGLTDTYLAIILPSLATPFGVFLMRVYAADAVDNALIEAARVDGVGELRIFFTVALRLLLPGSITVLLFSLVATWNNYFLPLIMLNSADKFPLTVGLALWQSTAAAGGGAQALFSIVITGSLLSIIPLVVAFLFLQRYWQSGLATGGVKA